MRRGRPSRVRRILKLAGVMVCALMLLLWATTFFWEFVYSDTKRSFGFGPGFFCVVSIPIGSHGWNVLPAGSSTPTWWPIPQLSRVDCHIPFSFLLLVTAIPTAILYRRDRRHPPGHCQTCGYDLTGNESGICPECGTACEVRGGTG